MNRFLAQRRLPSMMMAMCCGKDGLGEIDNRGTLFGTGSDFSGTVILSVQFTEQNPSGLVFGVKPL
jgi:hypothetical protein